VLTGKVRGGDQFSSATIVYEDGIMAANVRPRPGQYYQVRYAGNGVHSVREIDEKAFPPDGEPAPTHTQDAPAPAAPRSDSPEADSGPLIDVLVVYTPAARTAQGGMAAIDTLITLSESETNQGYANSGAQQRVRVVHRAEIAYTESGTTIANFETDRERLRINGDGHMDGVHALRDAHGADFVVLLRTDGGLCGIAYILGSGGPATVTVAAGAPFAFNVTAIGCSAGNFTFGHELGHTMAARHNIEADGTQNAPYTFNHGFCAPGGSPGYRTIMAVASTCSAGAQTRLNYWSNPSVSVNGTPSGNATADNQLTLDTTLPVTRDFRQKVHPDNDFFQQSRVITGTLPVNVTQSTAGSNAQPSEPNGGGCLSPDSSVWFAWTPSATGRVIVKTLGSNYDNQLAVYTGSSIGSLGLVPGACNDDGGPGLTARVRFNAVAGTTYRIQVDGFAASTGTLSLTIEPDTLEPRPDFDQDIKADMGVWTPSNGQFFALKSNGGTYLNFAGGTNQIPVPGDYDGDNISDAAVFEPNGAVWYIKKSTGGITNTTIGAVGATQIPVPADYDGDGKLDIAVWVPGNGFWIAQLSGGGYLSNVIGSPSSIPVPADYDGDRKADIAVWTPSNGQFFILKSTGGTTSSLVGGGQQIPVPADYDGDGRADLAVFAPNGAVWFVLYSDGGTLNTSLGAVGSFQFPLPTDYDGDGRADLAVRVPSNGFYLVQKSTGGFQSNNIGGPTAIPLAKRPQYDFFYPYDERPEEKRESARP